MNGKTMKSRLLASSVFAGAAIGLVATPAIAQEEDAEARQQTVTITGSRIQKQDFVSNSPVNTVGAEQFELTGTVNTESLLNTLPQTIPGFDRTSNNPGDGTASVDLRGLGTNRTLVLVDGRRIVPTANGVVDINNIPPALIERVEVVTGGASAVYGADAVSGVVNFILKDDFEGVEVTAGYETTQDGDADIWSTALTMGGNFGDDRGNAVLSLSYSDRAPLFQGDRDFASVALFDNGTNTGLEPGGSSGVPGTSIFSGILGAPTATAPGNLDFSPSAGLVFNPDGSVSPFRTSGDPNDFYNYAPVNYIQLPQQRFTATSMASYEINDSAEVYGRFMFANNNVPQQLAATPIFQTSTFSLDGNPFLTAGSQQLLSDAFGQGTDTDGDGIDDTGRAFLRRRMLEVGPRIVDSGFNAFQFTAGLKGEINANIDYDVYFQEGRVEQSFAQRGNVSRTAFSQALLLADADGDGNVDVDGSGAPTCSDTSNGCSPLNIFGQGNISDAAANFVNIRVNGDADYDQTIFAATLTGDTAGAFELPGGPIGLAGGVEYREEEFDFRPSQDLATGNIAGFNGQPPQSGGFDTYEAYAEAYLPFVTDAPWADVLALELAARVGNFSTSGNVSTYKVAGEWAPDEQIRFRASFNTAVRAPNIGELFTPPSEGFPGADDPCAADGGQVGNATVAAICEATGVPAGNVFSPSLNPASGQVRGFFAGNPDLDVEEAETITVGFVATPNFIPGLSLAVDYFDITIEEAIGTQFGGVNNILDVCYNTAQGGAGSDACNLVVRRADGTINGVNAPTFNTASLSLNGVDVVADYTFDAEDLFGADYGTFGLAYVGTFTNENTLVPGAGVDAITCAGEFGADCGEPIPEYKHRATAKWSNGGNITTQLAWRYIGGTTDDDETTIYFVNELDGQHYFDLSGSYRVNDNFSLTGGIDNLLDEDPPIIGDNDEQANTYPATYDVFGRTFFVRATATF